MMSLPRSPAVFLIILWLFFAATPAALADVTAGDVIDKSNWEKAQGLMPDPILEWLKRGDFSMEVVDLTYEPGDYVTPEVKKSLEANKGKYDVDANGLMIEKATGKLPKFIEGIPFPEIDPNDPNAASKLMYNKTYYSYALGNNNYPFSVRWVGRKSGLEREVICDYKNYPLDGAPGAREEDNSEKVERMQLILVLAPFDIKGTNIMSWRYLDDRQDSTNSYVPAIRRVRRMSPSNRSDSFVGSDICIDDAWLFDGKTMSMDWKFVGEREALVAFLSPDPQPLEITKNGVWRTIKGTKEPAYGYQDKTWQGAPWMPTNLVWTKRLMYVIQATPKDPYYNYGMQEIWLDAKMPLMVGWKIIHDRAGNYWKMGWETYAGHQGPEEGQKAIVGHTLMGIDDRTNHASLLRLGGGDYHVTYFDDFDRNDFTLAGFQRFCK